MKSSLLLTSTLACATLACAQGTTPASSSPAAQSTASPTGQLKVRGPEDIARQTPEKVVATIDGKPITAKQAVDMLNSLPADQRKRAEGNLSAFVQQLYTSRQLADQAVKLNLDQQSPTKEQLQLARMQVLAQSYLNHVAAAPSASSPAVDPQQYYNAHPQEFDQVKLSGIFIAFNPPGTPAGGNASSRTEEQARDKAAEDSKKLKAGTDFATLARTDSDNQQSASKGGELGTYALGDPSLPADLKSALEKLQPGQVSEPIRMPNAFIILKLESRNKLSFEQSKAGIVQKLQNEKNQAAVKQELDKYKIQVQDTDFFGSAGAGASASAASPRVPSLQRSSSGSASSSSSATTPKPQTQP
jgi:hypothetical protein